MANGVWHHLNPSGIGRRVGLTFARLPAGHPNRDII